MKARAFRTSRCVLIAAAAAALLLAAPAASQAQVPGREADPVVLKGSHLPNLIGTGPTEVVGFRWTGSAWDQVPVQVDERTTVPYSQIYNGATCFFGCGFAGLTDVYADPGTWTGADPDAALDAGDEVALMAKDTGEEAPAGEPAGVVPGSRVELKVSDPISGAARFVYLFASDGSLDQSAGESYVDYGFNLTSGDYKTTYQIPDGPNPETSAVETAYYRHDGLTDRWFDTNLEILGRGSTEVDILDGDKHQYSPSTCVRSESTFAGYQPDPAEGALVINKSGAVRAIRSYLGANSGPLTQKTNVYYEQRQDIRVDLRVHQIPAAMSFLDYSPAATGMTYRNPANLGGLTIDGQPETAAASPGGPAWEQVTGQQGTLDIVSRVTTDISPLTITDYWYDDSTPDSQHLQCSGDDAAYGSSGTRITSQVPNTDPGSTPFNTLAAVRHLFYDAPSQPAAQAILRDQQITWNLGVSVDGAAVIPPGPPPVSPPVGDPGKPSQEPAGTGKRAAAVKKCKKVKRKKKRRKCLRKARKLPL
ncbi:MAG: hypothetical protein ACXWFE_12350 [Solirubrobacterales bacterium]